MNIALLRLHIRTVIAESISNSKGYSVEFLDDGDIRSLQQFAYAVNKRKKVIYASKSGHGKILRMVDDDNAEDFAGGGWVFAKQGKITFHSGLLGTVEVDKDEVTSAVERLLKKNLRIAD